MGQALYRKYRSRSLDEIIGQEHVTKTLQEAIKQGRISHAYLLTGPRGVGKTSIARILAHEINDLPYTDDNTHIDIIEIDAASNRRIDEIRELRDKVNIAPTSAKYKVYIIDEVHMLTKEAFNALLKTLEEPPAHVVFILATTDAHKLPETIVSRTQRFSFKPVAKAQVMAHLRTIADNEKLKVSDEALELLAEHGEGSFRDSISLFDQASNQTGKLEISDVQNLLGLPPANSIHELLELLSERSASNKIIIALDELYMQGFQAASIAKQLAKEIRQQIANGVLRLDQTKALQLLSNLIRVPASNDPERFLEICLLEFSRIDPINQPTLKLKNEKAQPTLVTKTEVIKPVEVVQKKPTTLGQPKKELDETIWPEILTTLKQRHNTLYGIVRMAEPNFDGRTLRLSFSFAFHQKRSNENANKQRISDIVQDLTGQEVIVECILDAAAKPPKVSVPVDKASDSGDLSTISNIFGEAELLES